MSLHCFTSYVKVTFFNGGELSPPPVSSKQEAVRYLHGPESGVLDEAQFVSWGASGSRLPGVRIS